MSNVVVDVPDSVLSAPIGEKIFGLRFTTKILVLVCTIYAFIIMCVIFDNGGTAASLTIKYYSYSALIPNTTISVAIDALPRDVYKNVKTDAVILLISASTGAICFLGLLYCILFGGKEGFDYIYVILFLFVACVTFMPFGYNSFMTWKNSTLSETDRSVWDSVDGRFMELFSDAGTILGLTAPGFVLTGGIICYLRFFS